MDSLGRIGAAAPGRLHGRIAIVTGSGSPAGLGAGIAHRFALEGASVVCVDRDDPAAVVAALRAEPGQHHEAAVLDVTDRAAVEGLIHATAARHGRLDILVNNAGTYRVAPIDEETDESFRTQFEVNTYAVFVAMRAAAPIMKRQRWGRIITTASQLGKVGRGGYGVYAASKAAVVLLSQSAALELGPHGITVNCICPGSMHTRLLSSADGRAADEYAQELGVDVDTAFRGYIEDKIPVGRLGRPSDMGSLAAWLASDDGAFMTGSAVNLTGGEQVFF